MKKISKYILLVFFIGIADTSFSCDPTLLPILMKDQSANPALNDFFAGLPYGEYDDMVEAWAVLVSNSIWRKNVDYIKKVNRYFDEGLKVVQKSGQIVVEQADGLKVGQLDIDISDGNALKVLGESSGRHFDPDLAGGVIIKKSWLNPIITSDGISDIQAHVLRFGPDDANDFMIDRLIQVNNGQRVPDDFDKRYYTHELEEYQRYKNMGYEIGVPTDPNDAHSLWNNTHSASLESYGINEGTLPLYPPEAP